VDLTPEQIETTHQRALRIDARKAFVRVVKMRNTINALRMTHPNRNAAFDAALTDAQNALQRLAKFL
jgi:hypothetical protein